MSTLHFRRCSQNSCLWCHHDHGLGKDELCTQTHCVSCSDSYLCITLTGSAFIWQSSPSWEAYMYSYMLALKHVTQRFSKFLWKFLQICMSYSIRYNNYIPIKFLTFNTNIVSSTYIKFWWTTYQFNGIAYYFFAEVHIWDPLWNLPKVSDQLGNYGETNK